MTRSSLVQVTNLGITVKDSPQNTLVFVTRLDNGAPVSGANVSIVRTDNTTHWRGATDANGIALAPNTPLRDPEQPWEFSFIVIAEKDGDVAYVGSDWNEGISRWEFGVGYDLLEAGPVLRGTRLHRSRRLPSRRRGALQGHPASQHARWCSAAAGRHAGVHYRPRRAEQDRRRAQGAALGLEQRRVDVAAARRPVRSAITRCARFSRAIGRSRSRILRICRRGRFEMGEDYRTYRKSVSSSFLVAAYRRPDFRVDVTLTGATSNPLAGDKLRGVVNARYLFGAADAGTPGDVELHGVPLLRSAVCDHRKVQRRSLGVRRVGLERRQLPLAARSPAPRRR